MGGKVRDEKGRGRMTRTGKNDEVNGKGKMGREREG